ncbi:DinB family protein [Parasediminibacterium paludis]|uniref:DinB family protein n=1 Tax=Parasediminibacterium paludis TaxID=908966 RepID=A0ABV8PVW5_9BACT
MARPQIGDFSDYAQGYVNAAKGNSIEELIVNHSADLLSFLNGIPDTKADFTYAEGKWTVKQLLQHMIDTERILMFRALTFARKDKIALPGFDENNYAAVASASHRTLAAIKQEFSLLRQSTDLFLLSLTAEDLKQEGIASNHRVTVNALAYILFGHNEHHKTILIEKYL